MDKDKEKRIIAISVIIGGLLLGWVLGGWKGILVGVSLLIAGILGILLVWFVLAPRDIAFTFVEEGTAKAVMRGGAFEKIIFQWRDHWMDKNWNIWRDGEEGAPERKKAEVKVKGRIFGGLYFYGIPPFFKIHKYRLRWTDLKRVETKEGEKAIEKLHFHDEELDHVMLKPAVYCTKIFAAETKPPERIPVDVEVLITMRIANPYLFLFVAPPTPIEDVLGRIDALMRERVAKLSLDELLSITARDLWEGWVTKGREKISGLKEEKLITETLPKWGLKIADKGVDIKTINLPSEYQEAAAVTKRKELEAEGRAADIMKTLIAALVKATGKTEEEIFKEFSANPREFYQTHKPLIDQIMTKLSMEVDAYLRIETPGARGMEGSLLRLLGAYLRMPKQSLKKEKPIRRKKWIPPTEKTDEELKEEVGF